MNQKTNNEKIIIAVSSCLLGEQVRYDGDHTKHNYITGTLAKEFTLLSICPETGIGLGIPRPPIHLVMQKNDIHCVQIDKPENDVTEKLSGYALQQQHLLNKISGYIFKKKSPSCGLSHVKVFHDDHYRYEGRGVFADQVIKMFPLLPVIEEDQLDHSESREHFIECIYRYQQHKNEKNYS
ncbi:MAG: DUF523 domain-containing protein [Gammaproteobacteria bacterium]|nr:DUF523 domain-containing protein [Gammaproteobacteria bacterium]